jgi:SulP family sulfate permease
MRKSRRDTTNSPPQGQSRSPFLRELEPRTLLPSLIAGLVIGILTVVVESSYATLIFSGVLTAFLSRGITIILFGTCIVMAFTSLAGSQPGTVSVPQDTPVVILALISSGIAGDLARAHTSESIFVTVLGAVILTTVLTGLLYLLLGIFRLGNLIRYIPHPVIGGFLAGVGWLLLRGGVEVMAGFTIEPAHVPLVFETAALSRWLPGAVFGGVLVILLRRFNRVYVMPALIFFSIGVFYLVLLLTGTDIEGAGAGGWLLGPFPESGVFRPVSPLAVVSSDWGSIWRQLGNIGTILLMSCLAVLLNISGIELITGRDIDLNRELKVAGIGNILSGMVASPPSYHTLGFSALGAKLGVNSRVVGLFAAFFCGMALLFGMSLLAYFPKPVLGGMVVFIGASFLVEWLYDGWFRLPRMEYFIVLLILMVIGAFGFLEGVGVGILASVLIFIVNYSRVDVVSQSIPGSTMRSNVVRSPEQRRILRERGGQVHILRLKGFLFFGTAHSLFQTVRDRVGAEDLPGLGFLLIDFKRVTGLDSSTEISFVKIIRLLCDRRACLVCVATSPHIRIQLERIRAGERDRSDIQYFPDLDHGLEWCEDQILSAETVVVPSSPKTIEQYLERAFPDPRLLERLKGYMERVCVAAGAYVIRQGAAANDLFFIEQGEFSVQLEIEGEDPVRLRTMRAGTVFGEIALYLDVPRSASVVATEGAVYYRLTRDSLGEMQVKDPELALAFQDYLIQLLSDRLVDLNRTIRDLSP